MEKIDKRKVLEKLLEVVSRDALELFDNDQLDNKEFAPDQYVEVALNQLRAFKELKEKLR